MDPARFKLAEEIFQFLADAPPAQRPAILDLRCGGDAELRGLVRGLLENHDVGMADFLQNPVIGKEWSDVACGSFPLPERIGRYAILRKLGEGGMSIVYEARQEQPRRTVALKVIRPGLASEPLLRRFQLEAELLGRLQHPGIAAIHDAGLAEVVIPGQSTSRQPYFALELVRGRTLDRFAADQQLSVPNRLQLFIKVCDAVAYAHENGIIHRDLKPANILVDDRGQPKVLDFGVARLTDADVQTTTMHTQVGQWIGTVPYMSPEQVGGDARNVDFRADIYALGVLLFELLVNRHPHDIVGRSLPEAARIIREVEPTRLGNVHTRFRGDLDTIVAKSLEKDRTRRYASAAELAADIRRHLANQPISARPPSTIYQVRKFALRHRTLTTSIGILFVMLSAFGVWMSILYKQADRLRFDANREAQRARQTQTFLENMLSSIDPEVAKGKDTSLIRGILSEAAARAGVELSGQPDVEADIRATIGDTYLSVGLAREAQAQFETALTIRRDQHGGGHDSIAATLRRLAQCAAEIGDRERAEKLAREALALRRKQFPDGHAKVVEAMQTLGWMVSELGGNREEAASLLRESLEMIDRLGLKDRQLYANGLHNLAVVFWRWPKLDEAEDAARRTLSIKKELLGADHPSVARAMDLLASILMAKKEFDEAEPLVFETLELHRRLFGEDHHAFVGALNNLGQLYWNKGDFAAAEPVMRQALDLIRKSRGDDSHETAMAWLNLANTLDKGGKVEEAAQLYRVADERFRAVFPPDHPFVHSPMTRHAEMLDRLRRHDEARVYWEKLVGETRTVFPSGHVRHNIAVAELCALSRCLLELKDCTAAEPLLLECQGERRTAFGPDHRETIRAVESVIRHYEECGPAERAAEFRAMLDTPSPE